MKQETLRSIVENFGKKYSEMMSIELSDRKNGEIFKWFLASMLFGAPITETSVIKTYKCFQKYDVLTPERILETGWDGLVRILDEGGYTRYDFKTADKLLKVTKNLIEKYGGSLSTLYEKASDEKDLEERLKELGKGVGDATVSIFLRELRDVWKKARPSPTKLVVTAAKNLGAVDTHEFETVLEQLEEFWSANRILGASFVNFETALLRIGKDFCRKEKCAVCSVKDECLNRKAT
ncbi:MAG: hypothetical protein ACUVUE_06530 [Candidatus Bathycorpusculaceae bacterium]